MANDRTKVIPRGTPESAAMLASVKRAMAITANLNRLTFNNADEVRALFSDLIGKTVDDSFLLIPPFYTTGGADISVGRNVFINQNCTFYDLGGLDIADDVMIGRNSGRELGRCSRLSRHQGRPSQHARRGKSGESHSLDWRLRKWGRPTIRCSRPPARWRRHSLIQSC